MKFVPAPIVVDSIYVHDTYWEAPVFLADTIVQFYYIKFDVIRNLCVVSTSPTPKYKSRINYDINVGDYNLIGTELISLNKKDTIKLSSSISKTHDNFVCYTQKYKSFIFFKL